MSLHSPDDDGLRETFLASFPSGVTEQLRIFVRGLYDFATRYRLSARESDCDRQDALLVGLWKELDYLGRFSASLETQARGSRRSALQRVRELLEDARKTMAQEVPETHR